MQPSAASRKMAFVWWIYLFFAIKTSFRKISDFWCSSQQKAIFAIQPCCVVLCASAKLHLTSIWQRTSSSYNDKLLCYSTIHRQTLCKQINIDFRGQKVQERSSKSGKNLFKTSFPPPLFEIIGYRKIQVVFFCFHLLTNYKDVPRECQSSIPKHCKEYKQNKAAGHAERLYCF